MKVSLIIPPSTFLLNPRMFLPLGPLYLSAVLKQHGNSVEVVDLAGGEPMPEVEADIYGISVNTATFPYACQVLGQIKELKKDAHVVIGGPMATVDPHTCLKAGFDQAVIGDGENAVIKISEGCRDRIIRDPLVEDLDSIPFPDRDVLIHNYHAELDDDPCTNIVTSRGCPYKCVFCVKNWGDKVRFHSTKYILREAASIKEKQGIRALWFFDDEMLMNKERDLEIFRGLKELGIIFRIFTRSNLMDEKTAKILSECGCREVLIGVESGSEKIKRVIRKGTTVEVDKKAIKMLNFHGVRVKATFIVGLPSESPETLEETWRLCEEIEDSVADFDFSILTVYPGSALYSHPEKFDLKFEAGYKPFKTKPDEYACMVSTSSLSSGELLKWRERLEKRYKPKDRLR